MKKVLCWLCYHIGDTIYKVIDRWDLMAPVFYDLYSWFILKSCDLDEWGMFWYTDYTCPNRYWHRLCIWAMGEEKGFEHYVYHRPEFYKEVVL